jgi:hypothetical protein
VEASSAGARLLICSLSEAKLDHYRSKTYWANGEASSDDELSSFCSAGEPVWRHVLVDLQLEI